MTVARYVVLDDALPIQAASLTADQLAEALRAPLAAIGVRVVRQRGMASLRCPGGFQAHGCSRSLYFAKRSMVEHIVRGVAARSDAVIEPRVAGVFPETPTLPA